MDSRRFDHSKYQAFQPVAKSDRRWPDQVISVAPQWCSVDLRDGNQALVEPMNAEQKLRLWELLLSIGFTQIEVGFPSASSHDFAFLRKLIEENRIPEGVTVQVLTQARADLIEKTFAALEGVKRAVVHFYNSTSTVQREYVFGLDRQGILDIAVTGARLSSSRRLCCCYCAVEPKPMAMCWPCWRARSAGSSGNNAIPAAPITADGGLNGV